MSGFLRRIARAIDFWSGEDRETPGGDLERIHAWCLEALEKRGKIAALMAIAKVADAYERLDEAGRDGFFAMLKDEFAVRETEVHATSAAYRAAAADGEAARAEALVRLHRALESPRLALFEQFNTIPSGMKFLVDLREHLAARLANDPAFAPLEYELRRLLSSFFNLGFLHLERIGWDSPAALLEKLVEYQAVHRIAHWRDLKHRLISDRACFAFLHPAMPCEPVIFVEVALVAGMADSIQRLLDPEAPDLAPDQTDTAIFYGISNAQKGLRGIALGNLLIKQVVVRLRSEVPNLKTFATLSPLPRFRRDFLEPALAEGSIVEFFKGNERNRLCVLARKDSLPAAVASLLAAPDWHGAEEVAEALRPGLLRAARNYLTERQYNGHAACPVAHFHGSNGALLARVNWLGDVSEQGRAQSAGIMANYRYDIDAFERHQNHYLQTGHIAVDRKVREL